MICVLQRASVHHVHMRSLPFEYGDDDYLFILISGHSKMRAAALPAIAFAAAAAVCDRMQLVYGRTRLLMPCMCKMHGLCCLPICGIGRLWTLLFYASGS
jgi:hypothetical protein